MSAAEDRSENIRLLRESAAAIIPGDYRRIRALRFTDPGFDRAVWQEMCDMGWAALRVPEAQGGSGLGVAEYCALAEELGRGLVPEPLIGAVTAASVLSGSALGGTALGEAMSGASVILPAWQERANTIDCAGDTRVAGGRRQLGTASPSELTCPLTDISHCTCNVLLSGSMGEELLLSS